MVGAIGQKQMLQPVLFGHRGKELNHTIAYKCGSNATAGK